MQYTERNGTLYVRSKDGKVWSKSSYENYAEVPHDPRKEFIVDSVNDVFRSTQSPEKESQKEVNQVGGNHYQLIPSMGLEVRHVVGILLHRLKNKEPDFSLEAAGWYQQTMQYLMRFMDKGGRQDIEKSIQTLTFMLEAMDKKGN